MNDRDTRSRNNDRPCNNRPRNNGPRNNRPGLDT